MQHVPPEYFPTSSLPSPSPHIPPSDFEMGFNALPQEVIDTIVSSQSPSLSDLHSYSLVCRSMWESSTTFMYAHIDLTVDNQADHDKVAKAKTQKRQPLLLKTIALYSPSRMYNELTWELTLSLQKPLSWTEGSHIQESPYQASYAPP